MECIQFRRFMSDWIFLQKLVGVAIFSLLRTGGTHKGRLLVFGILTAISAWSKLVKICPPYLLFMVLVLVARLVMMELYIFEQYFAFENRCIAKVWLTTDTRLTFTWLGYPYTSSKSCFAYKAGGTSDFKTHKALSSLRSAMFFIPPERSKFWKCQRQSGPFCQYYY